jgi:hypothetical protein
MQIPVGKREQLSLIDPPRLLSHGNTAGISPSVSPDEVFVLSYGMGVESDAILKRWITQPETRPFLNFDQLIVVTSQVGEEHLSDTIPNVEEFTLPLLRKHGIRFVELARRGHLEADGIVVLQDTRAPAKLHPEGVYKLSDELLACGTVPQFGGEHRCALKFKAFVIETWLAFEFRGEKKALVHAFGYNEDEQRRIARSQQSIAIQNKERTQSVGGSPLVVFGFNSEELGRIERAKKYDGPARRGLYPLATWGWNRERCIEFLHQLHGVEWKKSHCSFCPFCGEAAKGLANAVARWHAAPEQTAHGLLVEFNSLCFNPRGSLFKDSTLLEMVRKRGVKPVLEVFERRLNAMSWGLYRVRRIYSKKGKAIRAVQQMGAGSRLEMFDAFRAIMKSDPSLESVSARGIDYAFFQRRTADVYPAAEGFYVTAPLFVREKVRGTMEKFDARWDRVVSGLPLNRGDEVSFQDSFGLLEAVA